MGRFRELEVGCELCRVCDNLQATDAAQGLGSDPRCKIPLAHVVSLIEYSAKLKRSGEKEAERELPRTLKMYRVAYLLAYHRPQTRHIET